MKIEVNTYYELFNLLQESPLFKFLKNIQQLNVNRLRRKKKIKIAFQVATLSTWCADFVPRLLSSIEKFDVMVIITWQMNTSYEQEVLPAIEYFKKSGLKYSVDSTVPSRVKTDSDGMFEKVDGKYRVHDIEVYNRVTGEYEKLDLNKEYTVGGINYILRNSGNGCSMFKNCDQVVDFVGQDCDIMSKYIESFAKEGEFPLIKTANSPLSAYKGYLIDYENPYGSGRILIK